MADSQSASSSRSSSPASDDIDAVASPSQPTGIEPISRTDSTDDVQLDDDNTGTSAARPSTSAAATANNGSPTSSRRPGAAGSYAAGTSAVQASRPSRQSDRRRAERYNGRQSQQTMDGLVAAGGAMGDERAERQTFDRLLDTDYLRDFGDPFARFDHAQEQQRLHQIQQAQARRASQSAPGQDSQPSVPATAAAQGGEGQGRVQSGDVTMS